MLYNVIHYYYYYYYAVLPLDPRAALPNPGSEGLREPGGPGRFSRPGRREPGGLST